MATKSVKSTSNRTTAPKLSRRSAAIETLDHDQIARRAYERFLARGATHGHDLEDWLLAEREMHSG